MTDPDSVPETGAAAALSDDVVQPFMIDATGLHGRMVKLGPSVNAILDRHGYPEAVQHLLAEMLALGAGLAAALKFDGVFTLQTKGDGPVPMLVADVTSDGVLRGYAQVKGEIPALHDVVAAPVPKLLGEGYLAFTVDQGENMERYQGIVALEGATVEECVQRYFEQSDQFASAVKLVAGKRPDGTMGAAALLLQKLPEEGGNAEIGHADEEDWRRSGMLMETATAEELLDPALAPNDMLYRLFHEDGVRVFEPRTLTEACRCSRDRIESVLSTMEKSALDELRLEDGSLEVVCEFCSRAEVFTESDRSAWPGSAE